MQDKIPEYKREESVSVVAADAESVIDDVAVTTPAANDDDLPF